eukprot:gene56242-75099_t
MNRTAPALVGQPVTVGVRPEHLKLGAGEFTLDITPKLIEHLGIHTVIYANLKGGESFVSLFEGDTDATEGSSVRQRWIDGRVTLELASRPEPRHAPLDLVGVLRAEREGLTLSQKLLSDMVLADVGAVLRMSIVDLANQAEVSPPTVTRFCRRLGCDSYAEFKLRLAQSNFVGQRYNLPQRGPDTIDDIAHVVADGIHGAVNDVVRHLDAGAMERAAEAIAAADYVVAFGSGGSSSMIASETEARLFRLGIKVSCSIDHQ